MGKILLNQWEIQTDLEGLKFNYQGQDFDFTGNAIVVYRNDEIDMYLDVDIDNLKIWFNQVLLDTNREVEKTLYNSLHDYLTELLESEISLEKLDITNEDLKVDNGQLVEVDEALIGLGIEIS